MNHADPNPAMILNDSRKLILNMILKCSTTSNINTYI